MCGFAGIFSREVLGDARIADVWRAAECLTHRGPDESGSFVSADGRCAIGFRRLSIIDLANSHQPMSDPASGVTIAFNGEIYNYAQLREKLISQGIPFNTHGDTEVLLRLYLQKGIDMPADIKGMFALAIYDSRSNSLFIARDHLGQKPLWIAKTPNSIAFASEINGLKRMLNCHDSLDFNSIALYLTMGYIPSGRSIYKNITSLRPGSYAVINMDDMAVTPKRYYSPTPAGPPKTYTQAVEQTRELVTRSVKAHMIADVPVGVLLSGGTDSAVITAVAARLAGSANPLLTFTAGFDMPAFDERPVAQKIAAHCKTRHTPLLVTPDLDNIFFRMANLYGQPFADSSALATQLICAEARKHVKVALGGDGGDEIFAGYDRYRAMRMGENMGVMKYLALRILAGALRPIAPHEERNHLRRIIRFADGLGLAYAKQYYMYRSLFDTQGLGKLLRPEFIEQIDIEQGEREFCELYEQGDFDSEVIRVQNHDLLSYLPDDLLVKTDIASMANSLELRAPLLDPQIVDFGLGLPPEWKISRSQGKKILRDAFRDMLPAELFKLPKRGFGLPLGDWLAGELREQLKAIITNEKLYSLGIFNPAALASLFNEHVSRKADHRHRLWAIGVLGAFLIQHD